MHRKFCSIGWYVSARIGKLYSYFKVTKIATIYFLNMQGSPKLKRSPVAFSVKYFQNKSRSEQNH